jgi:hypothetical protein
MAEEWIEGEFRLAGVFLRHVHPILCFSFPFSLVVFSLIIKEPSNRSNKDRRILGHWATGFRGSAYGMGLGIRIRFEIWDTAQANKGIPKVA